MTLHLVPPPPDPNESPRTISAVREVMEHAPAGRLSVLDLSSDLLPLHEFLHAAWDYACDTERELVWVDLGGMEGTGKGVAEAYGSPSTGFRCIGDNDPDFGDFWEFDQFAPPAELDTFGAPSIPRLASTLIQLDPPPGAVLVLEGSRYARPYARMIKRLEASLSRPARDSALNAMYAWLADDLDTFARHRPNEPTIVIVEPDDPRRDHLNAKAALIITTV